MTTHHLESFNLEFKRSDGDPTPGGKDTILLEAGRFFGARKPFAWNEDKVSAYDSLDIYDSAVSEARGLVADNLK